MNTTKSLLGYVIEAIDHYRVEQRNFAATTTAPRPHRALPWLLRQLMPNLGSVVLVLILLTTFPGLAAQSSAPMGTSLSTIPYQGRLADASGHPITARQNMEFRLYDTPVGGTPLWEEFWTGGNSVNVSDGLFSVMLGSINTGLVSVVQGNDQLYLGITVGTDTEMAPRVQLGSVPFAVISLTVPDGSVTDAKLANPISSQYIAQCFTYHPTACPNPVSDFSSISVGGNKIWSGKITFTPFPTRIIAANGYIHLASDTVGIGDIPVAVWETSPGVARFSTLVPESYFNTTNSRLRVTIVGH